MLQQKVAALLENIRFEQSVFTLPFAYLGMVLAARGLPTLDQFFWVTVAMFGARTFGMSMNRLADLDLDRRNPRAAARPLPSGRLTTREVVTATTAAVVLLFVAAWQLNPLCVALAPVALLVFAGYSYVKRVSWLTHGVLGLCLGGAPVGGWIAVTGTLTGVPLVLGLTVMSWATGFDIIYACGDAQEDRTLGVYTLPVRFGIKTALVISALCHVITVGLLISVGLLLALGPAYWLGVLVAALLLAYEHSLLRPNDLSRLNLAFFRLNGLFSVIVFAGAFLSLYT